MTRCIHVSSQSPESEIIAEAAAVLKRGGIVAFPTETVYGLGANALNAAAVRSIFVAKGRPQHNPVIVHVLDVDAAKRLALEWPAAAQTLAERFWPGPLTLVLKKRSIVPDEVTSGGSTVAIRCPAHKIARALIAAAGVPLAAPSANASNRVSATTAAHVLKTLNGRIDLILDGGPADGGIESTVVDVTTRLVRILRPGLIDAHELESALHAPVGMGAETPGEDAPAPSPGMLLRHYAPTVPLEVVDDDRSRVAELAAAGLRVGWLSPIATESPAGGVVAVQMPADAHKYGKMLYRALYDLEERGIERIVVQRPPDTAEWSAIQDRLRRASATV